MRRRKLVTNFWILLLFMKIIDIGKPFFKVCILENQNSRLLYMYSPFNQNCKRFSSAYLSLMVCNPINELALFQVGFYLSSSAKVSLKSRSKKYLLIENCSGN